jgi:hypothetical protein
MARCIVLIRHRKAVAGSDLQRDLPASMHQQLPRGQFAPAGTTPDRATMAARLLGLSNFRSPAFLGDLFPCYSNYIVRPAAVSPDGGGHAEAFT